jgi:superfamily II DNA/RNA helicase
MLSSSETDEDVEEQEGDDGSVNYEALVARAPKNITWARAELFGEHLLTDLRADSGAIRGLLVSFGEWTDDRDSKLQRLIELLAKDHPDEKVLVLTEYKDTADYVAAALERHGVADVASATGETNDPTAVARRFSPRSNTLPGHQLELPVENEHRVLVATDVLSEGQNLQDAHIVVNYDLPWAIIRLVQRAGRVDRIGQKSDEILCYSFLPADGVERLIRLRSRVRQRLKENHEVVGSDEAFFEDDKTTKQLRICTTKRPVFSTATRIQRLTSPPTPIKYGRML